MVVLDDFVRFAATVEFGSIDHDSRVIIALNLTAVDLLQPTVVCNLGHAHPLRRIGVEHGEKDAAERGGVDVLIKEADVRIVRFGDLMGTAFRVFGVPSLPSSD